MMCFQIGDRVMAFTNYNAWAEVVCTPQDWVYKIPDDMTFPEAAAFSMNFVAAYMMLFEVANLREGMSVLVHSAGGGVVSFYPGLISYEDTETAPRGMGGGFNIRIVLFLYCRLMK